jgi:copper chaperone CopZ
MTGKIDGARKTDQGGHPMQELGLTDVSATAKSGCGCGGGGACACGGHSESHASSHGGHHAEAAQRFAVAGMTCSHCVSSVTEELSALDGVESVSVDLNPGAVSTVVVNASRALGSAEVRAAVEDAGYTLAH